MIFRTLSRSHGHSPRVTHKLTPSKPASSPATFCHPRLLSRPSPPSCSPASQLADKVSRLQSDYRDDAEAADLRRYQATCALFGLAALLALLLFLFAAINCPLGLCTLVTCTLLMSTLFFLLAAALAVGLVGAQDGCYHAEHVAVAALGSSSSASASPPSASAAAAADPSAAPAMAGTTFVVNDDGSISTFPAPPGSNGSSSVSSSGAGSAAGGGDTARVLLEYYFFSSEVDGSDAGSGGVRGVLRQAGVVDVDGVLADVTGQVRLGRGRGGGESRRAGFGGRGGAVWRDVGFAVGCCGRRPCRSAKRPPMQLEVSMSAAGLTHKQLPYSCVLPSLPPPGGLHHRLPHLALHPPRQAAGRLRRHHSLRPQRHGPGASVRALTRCATCQDVAGARQQSVTSSLITWHCWCRWWIWPWVNCPVQLPRSRLPPVRHCMYR